MYLKMIFQKKKPKPKAQRSQCHLQKYWYACITNATSLSKTSSWAADGSKHITEFHQSPNYLITFELNWPLSHVYKRDCGFLIWKLISYDSLWIWIVMAPGKLHKLHAPLPFSTAYELLVKFLNEYENIKLI